MATIKVHSGGPQTIWSNAGSTTYHAALPPVESTQAAYARVTQEMANKTSGITGVKVAVRYTEVPPPDTCGNPVPIALLARCPR